MQNAFDTAMRSLVGISPPAKLAMAVSGGVDSMALASLTHRWASKRNIKLHAFILDHGLRENSSQEAGNVKTNLEKIGVEADVLNLDLSDVTHTRMEAEARRGRRRLLRDACLKHNCSSILHGHHLNDQQESLLLRLLHHSQWYGLAGMVPKSYLDPEVSPREGEHLITQLKPLLKFPKSALRTWCEDNNITWYEDPTNQDISLTERNCIRRLLADCQHDVFLSRELPELVEFFGTQRETVFDQGKLTHDALAVYGSLVYDKTLVGRAKLQVTREFQCLAPAIQTQVLFIILAQLSPLSTEAIFTRRKQVSMVVDKLDFKSQSPVTTSYVALGVHISYVPGPKGTATLYMTRTRPRSSEEVINGEIYECTADWSDWHKIDNRWWFRWRNPSRPDSQKVHIRLLGNIHQAAAIAKEFFDEQYTVATTNFVGLRKELPNHPFISLIDPENPLDTVDQDSVVGFPTLGLMRSEKLQVQYKFQQYAF